MDKAIIKDMKHNAHLQFSEMFNMIRNYELTREQTEHSATKMTEASQAYAALCQAEAMERIADALHAVKDTLDERADHDGIPTLRIDTLGRGDQSIADAISEQVTDPPDILTFPWQTGASWYCVCSRVYDTEKKATECVEAHL